MRQRKHKEAIIKAYAEWFKTQSLTGAEAYLLTFMFNPLPQGERARKNIITKQITRVYAKQLTRHVRNPKSTPYYHYPIWIGYPDWPVYKKERQSTMNVLINDGLHAHVVAQVPTTTRMKECFAEHINDNQDLYASNKTYIQRIDAVPIDDAYNTVMNYIFKSDNNLSSSFDDLILLPRSSNEMWD